MTETNLPAIRQLEQKGIAHKVFVHSGPVHSLEQAAAERGQIPEQVVRSLLFRLGEGTYTLILVGGSAQIPWKALRQYFAQRRLTLASEDEVLKATGHRIGAVSPFGISQEIPTYIDQSVLNQEELSLGSGKRGTAIILKKSELLAALPNAQTVDLFTKGRHDEK